MIIIISYSENTCSKALYIYAVFNNFFKKCNRNLTFKSFSYFSLNPLKKYWKLTKVKKVHVHKWWLDIFYVPKSILVYTFPHSYNNMYKLTFTNANNFKTDYVINNNVMICDLFCISSCSEKHWYGVFLVDVNRISHF